MYSHIINLTKADFILYSLEAIIHANVLIRFKKENTQKYF